MVPYCGATQLERVSPIGTLLEIIYFQGLFILKLCRRIRGGCGGKGNSN